MNAELTERGREKLTYSPGIDGLRAIAVGAVIAYHLDKDWAAGGFLGVEVFLVISGYLITALMLAEYERTNRIALRSFWFRRARRLLPAVFTTIAVVVAYLAIALPDELFDIRGDVIAALGYVTNWFLSFSNESYFEALGRPSPLRHLWSLAVEEQWYLIWPVVFIGALKVSRGRIMLVGAAIAVGAVASTLLMAALYDPAVDPSRIYYGTDTRASGLLLGSLLALVWSPWKLDPAPGKLKRGLLDATSVIGIAGLVIVFWRLDEFSSFLYRGGFLVVGLLTCAAIAGLVHPSRSALTSLLAWKPLVWLGTRSYGLYLWHWPIIAVTRSRLDVDLNSWQLDLLRVGLSIVLAEVSFQIVERPIRNGALARLHRQPRMIGHLGLRPRSQGVMLGFGAIVVAAAVTTLTFALARAEPTEPTAASTADVAALINASATVPAQTVPAETVPAQTVPHASPTSAPPETDPTTPVPTTTTAPKTTAAPTTTGAATTTTTEARLPRRVDVTGDSVAITMKLNFPSDLKSIISVEDAAIEGCGVIERGSMLSGGKQRRNFAACAGFAERWAASAVRHDSEVVLVVLGAWEVFDIRLDGEDIVFGSAAHDEIITSGVRSGVSALVEAGLQVALLEVPCYSPVDGGGLKALPERGDTERTRHLTELLRSVASDTDHVHMVTPPEEFCTDSNIATDLNLRWDGVHYGPLGGAFVWGRIQDQLLAIPVEYRS